MQATGLHRSTAALPEYDDRDINGEHLQEVMVDPVRGQSVLKPTSRTEQPFRFGSNTSRGFAGKDRKRAQATLRRRQFFVQLRPSSLREIVYGRLKKIVVQQTIDIDTLKAVLSKKWRPAGRVKNGAG